MSMAIHLNLNSKENTFEEMVFDPFMDKNLNFYVRRLPYYKALKLCVDICKECLNDDIFEFDVLI